MNSPDDPIRISPINPFRRLALARGGKRRSRSLSLRLAGWNRELRPPDQLASTLALGPADLAALDELGRRPDGWQAFEFSPGASAADHARLAALGLIRLAWPYRRVALTDAGRFLLVLAAAGRDEV